MKNLNKMKARQKDFVGHLCGLTEKYVAGLEKEKIQTILLSVLWLVVIIFQGSLADMWI